MKGTPQLSKGAADTEDDTDPGHPRVTRTSAGSTHPPLTTGASSVFALARSTSVDPPEPRATTAPVARTRLDPKAVQIKKGVPLPAIQTGNNGVYVDLWNAMTKGDMVELPAKQAAGLAAHVKKVKGQCAVRALGVGVKGVWRMA